MRIQAGLVEEKAGLRLERVEVVEERRSIVSPAGWWGLPACNLLLLSLAAIARGKQ